MARRAGYGGNVYLGAVNPPDDTVDVLGVKSWSLDIDCDALESTGMDSVGLRYYIPGLTGWKGTLEAVWDTIAAGVTEPRDIIVGSTFNIRLLVSATLNNFYQATNAAFDACLITRSSPNVTVDGIVSYTVDFVGNGALTWPAAG